MPAFRVEGLEIFASENRVQLGKRFRSLRPLVRRVTWTHQVIYDATEDLRWMRWAVMRLREHRLKNIGHPAMPRRTVVRPIRVQFLKRLGNVHTRLI